MVNREDFPKGNGKLSHLNGTGTRPDNPKFHAWDEEKSKYYLLALELDAIGNQ